MDYETVEPRTCQTCKGAGFVYFGDSEEYDVQPCDECGVPK